MIEEWKPILYDPRYQVSSMGRFRHHKFKKGWTYIRPYRKGNVFEVRIKDKKLNCARLVCEAFIRPLKDNEVVYHKNRLDFDNYFRNLAIMTRQQAGRRTGHISKSKCVVQIQNGEISKWWRSARAAAKDLYVSYQTVSDYCNNKVQFPMYNLMWEEEYFEKY